MYLRVSVPFYRNVTLVRYDFVNTCSMLESRLVLLDLRFIDYDNVFSIKVHTRRIGRLSYLGQGLSF